MTRKHYIAKICVFRQGQSQTLCCDITTQCGKKWTLWNCPKSLSKLTTYGGPVQDNLFIASFTSNPDGSNIRAVNFIREINTDEYKSLKGNNIS